MLAGSRRRSTNRSIKLCPTFAMLLAAWIGYACLPSAAIAAETTSSAGTGLERPSDYDPFVMTAVGAVSVERVDSGRADNYDPFITTAVGADPFEQTDSGRADVYDPFEALPPTRMIEATSDIAPINAATVFTFQKSMPLLAEALPAPPPPALKLVSMLPTEADPATDAAWTPKPLGDLSTNIRLPGGMLPRDYSTERPPVELPYWDPSGAARGWPLTCYHWQASCFHHNPLYFEEINLERYGYGCWGCLQYGVSAAHFFGTVPALPYLMTVDCPGECDYTLGHYRPGSCPPWRFHWPDCSPLAAAAEGGVLTGLIFLIP